MIRPGTYMARAVFWNLLTAKNGTEYVDVSFSITVGEFKGEQIHWKGFFTDKTAERTFEALRAMGWGSDDPTDLRGIDRNAVEIVTETEVYENKERANVKWVNTPGRVAPGEMSQTDKVSFAQRMKARAMKARLDAEAISGVKRENAPAASPPDAEPEPELDENGIPF